MVKGFGGQERLAKRINFTIDEMIRDKMFASEEPPSKISQQNISSWFNRVKNPIPPAEYVIPIEIATGIPREKLRPDLYVKIEKTQAA